MSAIFNGSSSELTIGSALLGAPPSYPCAVAVWFKPSNTTHTGTLFGQTDNAVVGSLDAIFGDIENASDDFRVISGVNGTLTQPAQSTVNFQASVWQLALMLWVAANDRKCWLSTEGAWQTNTTSRSPAGLASTTFGSLRLDGSNRTNRFNGRMAEAAGWTGVNATTFQSDAPTALYTNLTPPKNYSNGTLVIYKRLLGEEGGPDDVGGTFTATDMTYDSGDHPLNYGGRGVGRRASLCHGIERRNYGREGALVA